MAKIHDYTITAFDKRTGAQVAQHTVYGFFHIAIVKECLKKNHGKSIRFAVEDVTGQGKAYNFPDFSYLPEPEPVKVGPRFQSMLDALLPNT